MAVGCGAQCAKVMLIIFNSIFWLSGAAILGVGIWLRVDPTIIRYLEVVTISSSDRYLEYAAYVLIGLGAFVFLVGMVGCCGAIRESKFCLGLYMFFLILVMAGEIAAGVLAIIFRDRVESTLTNEAVEKLKKDYNGSDAFATAIQYVELKRKCCGINGPSDYKNYTDKGNKLPVTCCVLADGQSPSDVEVNDDDFESKLKNKDMCQREIDTYYYKNGCKEALLDFIKGNAIILIGVGIGIACLEIFGFIFAVCLCRNVGGEEM